ncbi:MAG: T9SS type A sorting domain-containing protein [Winogradskyella sp.]|uniref:T9SS type A sorting domain-containing protein n=1 Tax=Winogradskyella sp. TaxID=1883156 RepID=UPI00385E22D1
MTKKLLLIGLILSSFFCQAQFDVIYQRNNSVVPDGQSYTFSTASCDYSEPCAFKFGVTNTSANDIYVKIFVDELVNNDGSSFQLCFAEVCLNSIVLDEGYPSSAVLIAPGTTNVFGNSFWNLYPAGIQTAMSWTFRFQAFDTGTADNEIGTPISMTYNYQPTLSIEDAEISNLEVFPTVVENEINISADENISAIFYDITGKKIKEINLISGNHVVNISDLTSQIYFVSFKNELGLETVKKIIKK